MTLTWCAPGVAAKEEPVNVNIDLLLLHNVLNFVTIT